MSDPTAPTEIECPRCRTKSRGAAWCPQCALNLRRAGEGSAPEAQLEETVRPRMPGLLWDTVPGRPSPWVKVAGVVVAFVAVLVVAAIANSSGGGSQPPVYPASFVQSGAAQETSTPEETPSTPESTDSTSTETGTNSEATSTEATIEPSAVQQVLNEYESAYSSENIEGLNNLFSPNLEREDGTSAAEDLSQALATYRKQFSELRNPQYTLSEVNIQPAVGEATATANFSITSQNGTVGGSITFHLTGQEGKLLIDKLTIEHSR